MTDKKPTVSTQHPEYSAATKRWKLIRAIIDNDAQCYIRTPDVDDPVRSKQYKEDAILTNFTKLTRDGLTGLVFRKPPEIELPAAISHLFDDATGSGINIWQFSQSTTSETISLGRWIILNDVNNENKKGYMKPYAPETVINWKTRLVKGVVRPWLITLCEWIVKEDPDDPFCQDLVKQYRVLRLDENDVYFQEIYDADEEFKERIDVQDKDGKSFDYIPAVAIGSQNNDWVVDLQSLYDLAILNLGHYRCSADLLESSWICGQPTYHLNVGDTSEEEFKNSNTDIVVGARKMVITRNGRLDMIQANPNNLVSKIMEDILKQAASVGAKLIEGAQGTRETAEGAKIRYGSQNSALYILSKNVEWGILECLKIQCRFADANPDDVVFKLNDEFFEPTADPQVIAQQIMLLEREVISPEEVRDYCKRTGVLDPLKTDEEYKQELEKYSNPLMGAEDVTAGRNNAPSDTPDEVN